jgi:preprotein translocase subunit Sec63
LIDIDRKKDKMATKTMRVLNMSNHYTVLGVPANATKKQIKSAYLTLAKKYHPDAVNGCAETFKIVNHAYEILYDDEKRSVYDSNLFQQNLRNRTTKTDSNSYGVHHREYEKSFGAKQHYSTSDFHFDRKQQYQNMSRKEEEEFYREYVKYKNRFRDVFTMREYFEQVEKKKNANRYNTNKMEEEYLRVLGGTYLAIIWHAVFGIVLSVSVFKFWVNSNNRLSNITENGVDEQSHPKGIAETWGRSDNTTSVKLRKFL